MVLFAIVNASYEVLYVDVKRNGRISDGGILQYTAFYEYLKNHKLNIPTNDQNDESLNFVFIGDEAFPLEENILKPFPQTDLSHEKRIFNYRLCRARNVVENVFGLIASRFRVLHTAINVKVLHIQYMVLAICVLHNFLRRESATCVNQRTFDREDEKTHEILLNGEWRNESQVELTGLNTHKNPQNNDAKASRYDYLTYFLDKGKLSWQDDMVKRGKSYF